MVALAPLHECFPVVSPWIANLVAAIGAGASERNILAAPWPRATHSASPRGKGVEHIAVRRVET